MRKGGHGTRNAPVGLSRDLAVVAVALGAVCIAALTAGRIMIRSEVNAVCTLAMESFQGDLVEALIGLAGSPSHDLAARTRAVWALGRLRDPRAVPVLQALRTGEPCDHSRWVCQREVEKALTACQGRAPPQWPTSVVQWLAAKVREMAKAGR